MIESKNPYESPEVAEPLKPRSELPTTKLGKALLKAWLIGLGCIFATLPLEGLLDHLLNLRFRLGWLSLIASMVVLAIPWFTEANLQSRAVYFLCSVGAICMTFIAGAFATFLLGCT